jgi:hypothetical protein
MTTRSCSKLSCICGENLWIHYIEFMTMNSWTWILNSLNWNRGSWSRLFDGLIILKWWGLNRNFRKLKSLRLKLWACEFEIVNSLNMSWNYEVTKRKLKSWILVVEIANSLVQYIEILIFWPQTETKSRMNEVDMFPPFICSVVRAFFFNTSITIF